MVKVTDIEKLDAEKYDIDKIIEECDACIKRTHGWYPWEEAILDEEYPKSVRDEVARRYITEGGWRYVYHNTSSENGERPGLTAFRFSNTPIASCKNSVIVCADGIA